ncbi:hypothetical protein AAMO2058_000881100 [Amorphochlora amoebiformis]
MWGSKADIIDKAAKASFDVSFTDIQDSYSKSEGAINRDGEERLNIPSLSSRDVFDSWRRANDISPEKLRNPTIGTKDNSCFPNQRNPTDSETVEGIESLDHIFTRRMFQMKRQYDKEIDCMDDRIERLAQFSTTVVKRLKNQIISLRETVDKLAEENYQLKTDRRRSSLHVEVENSSLNMSPSRYSDTKCLEARQKAVPLGAFERGLSPPHTRVYSAPILACTPSPIAVRVQPVFTFAEPSHRPGSAASSRDHKYIHSSNLECPPNRSPLPASPINADRYSLSRSLRDLRVRQKVDNFLSVLTTLTKCVWTRRECTLTQAIEEDLDLERSLGRFADRLL